jgi:hypothetical protein
VTEARLVWDTWRRILTTDALVDAVLDPQGYNPQGYNPQGYNPQGHDPATLGLAADARAVLADYASTPVATETTIGAYRRGLVRNALSALKLAPLTYRLLHASELDVPAVAADYVQSIHYRDDGPNFWRSAADFVAYLAKLPAFAQPVRQDALALETAAIALMRRLGEARPAVWPESAALHPVPVRDSDRYVANRAAAVASSRHDLTPWLEDALDFAVDAELEPSMRHWLIYVPAAEAAHTYAELSERAARAFTCLSAPKTASELSSALDGLPVDEVIEVIGSLAEIGAVVREETA